MKLWGRAAVPARMFISGPSGYVLEAPPARRGLHPLPWPSARQPIAGPGSGTRRRTAVASGYPADIKPANVLVDDAGNAWLTGFRIASHLPHERQSPVPIETIAGTLAYMAPEQTGRMNRSIGTRSDLYSLGATLYQMFTGMLPFSAAAPLEWVHCHIARQPAPPGDRAAVPEPLS